MKGQGEIKYDKSQLTRFDVLPTYLGKDIVMELNAKWTFKIDEFD